MAKRAAPNEQPYRPLLDTGLMSEVLAQVAPGIAPAQESPLAKVVEINRAESVRRTETPRLGAETVPRPAEQERSNFLPQHYGEKFDQEKRILFTRSETQAVDRLVTSLAAKLNSQVKVSHVMRALTSLLLHAEGEIDKRAGELGVLVRPPNGDALALQRFEKEIARIIAAGLRDAGPIG
jgi:hypothetical protein